MSGQSLFPTTLSLSELVDGQEADFFAQMTLKEELTTRDGKPYVRVGFRDALREVSFPIWNDSPWIKPCQDWSPGEFYKLRATYRETSYGPQLDLSKVRAVGKKDQAEGFDPRDFQPSTRFDPAKMFDQLRRLAESGIEEKALKALVVGILDDNRERLLSLPAATRNHHAFLGGWLEHVLCVTQTCVYLADKYAEHYPQMTPPLDKGLVVAGGVLHDIGKLRELRELPAGAEYTPEGNLVGHILQGRDIVREAAAGQKIAPETLLRLEHIIISHQRLPEWGSPKPPMTPEALLVHYADDMDAKYQMMVAILGDHTGESPMTTAKNPLRQKIYRGSGAAGPKT